jgi:hypothetical protein
MGNQYSNRQRREQRFNHNGLVFLHLANQQRLRANGRDLSLSGIGIEFPTKLKGYRLGAEIELEFAMPNHLRGLKIKVQLKRVNTDSKGHDHCGFAIVDGNQLVKKRIVEMITFYEKIPRPFGRVRKN